MTEGTYDVKRPGNLVGEEGLLAAVIAQAVKDATATAVRDPTVIADARRYFAGEAYTRHLQLLGLPADLLPKEFEDDTGR